MNKFIKYALVFVFTFVTIFLPISLPKTLSSLKVVFGAGKYEKIKIRVDSFRYVSSRSSRGGDYSPSIEAYNKDLEIQFNIDDKEGVLFGARKGDERLEPHFHEYTKNHHDSVWIWYHPNARAIYAKEEDLHFPIGEEIKNLALNFILATIGLYTLSRVFLAIRVISSKKNKK